MKIVVRKAFLVVPVLLTAALCAACSKGGSALPPTPGRLPSAAYGAMRAPVDSAAGLGSAVASAAACARATLSVTPCKLGLLAVGPANGLSAVAAERGYRGTIASKNTCTKIATVKPTSGKGPKFRVKVAGLKAGLCAITFRDASGHKAVLNLSVTTTSIALAGPLSPSAKSATIVLVKPARKVSVNLTKCTNGCTVAGPPAPPGKDAFNVTISDGLAGKGTLLATTGATPISTTIKAGKSNVVRATLLNNVASLAFGTLPAGASGTALTAQSFVLAAKDADGNAIVGPYANAVTVSGASPPVTSLSVNGGAAGASVQVTHSADALTLNYNGLATAPVAFSASATGATAGSASFAPTVAAIVYTGATVGTQPEIDLYSTSGTGSTGAFAATQAGWSGAFGQAFTYAYSTVPSFANNCPNAGSAAAAYTIAPASPATATSFTATATASAPAGECKMTISGGAGASLEVLLTFSTSHVVIGAKHPRTRIRL